MAMRSAHEFWRDQGAKYPMFCMICYRRSVGRDSRAQVTSGSRDYAERPPSALTQRAASARRTHSESCPKVDNERVLTLAYCWGMVSLVEEAVLATCILGTGPAMFCCAHRAPSVRHPSAAGISTTAWSAGQRRVYAAPRSLPASSGSAVPVGHTRSHHSARARLRRGAQQTGTALTTSPVGVRAPPAPRAHPSPPPSHSRAYSPSP